MRAGGCLGEATALPAGLDTADVGSSRSSMAGVMPSGDRSVRNGPVSAVSAFSDDALYQGSPHACLRVCELGHADTSRERVTLSPHHILTRRQAGVQKSLSRASFPGMGRTAAPHKAA